MRAPGTEATGTSGQSFVKAQFEELGWGANSNFEHDLGTDLWLMARDDRRFELLQLVGVQVKNGESFFDSPAKDEQGATTGWWYAESDSRHFDYWSDHVVPHLLVLRNPRTHVSHWVHVTRDRLVSTGGGTKIRVPINQTVDLAHRDALIEVAMSRVERPQWEGTAWDGAPAIAEPDRLRYALVTPRLVAPHPNRGSVEIDAFEAIAMLIQMRLPDLLRTSRAGKGVNPEAMRDSAVWEWRLFAALHDLLVNGDRSRIAACIDDAAEEHQRVAAVVCQAVASLEDGDPVGGSDILEMVLRDDRAGPADHAWLLAHLSRCQMEIGLAAEARESALQVQALRRTISNDPTASAVAAAASNMIFNLSNWDEPALIDAIRSSDTVSSWWRSQTHAAGLKGQFDEAFKAWAGDTAVTYAEADEPWLRLRSAMLQSTFAADHSGWKAAGSQLARRQLMTSVEPDQLVSALDLLRLSGDKKSVTLALAKIMRSADVSSLQRVAADLDLDRSTRSSLSADLAFVEGAADVLNDVDADRFARWALQRLSRPTEGSDEASVGHADVSPALRMLRSVVLAASTGARRAIIDHIVELPPQPDQSRASDYGRLLARVPSDEWTERDLEALRGRPASDDNWELTDDVDALLADRDPSFREVLHLRIAGGDIRALHSCRKVSDLPASAAEGMIAALSAAVDERVDAAAQGRFGLGGYDVLDDLVLLNALHPAAADWAPVVRMLAIPNAHPDHIVQGMWRLGVLRDRIPAEIRGQLKPMLEAVADRTPLPSPAPFASAHDPRPSARLALALMFPDEVGEEYVRAMLVGSAKMREAAAELLTVRRNPDHLNLIALLARDSEIEVCAAAAQGLACWIAEGIAMPGALHVLRRVLAEGGVRLAVCVSSELHHGGAHPTAIDQLAALLEGSTSALVRARVAQARS